MLSTESLLLIDREIAKYPPDQKQSAVMGALRIAQTEKGWLPPELIDFIADYLSMPSMAVYEVASFYNMYDLKLIGTHKIAVCTNLPCALSGGIDAAEYLQQKLGIGFNQTTPDGRFTLKEAECMGACGDAPVMLHNNHKMCCRMTYAQIDALIEELSK